ncbi:MAG: DUF1294 domain-containing protein [Amylibacter sp.]|jgi:uncharacterized membrane protein YsdA (DUF1294 family)|nr:DUF1294 domain-containing protein [Amylibacter sp.]
MLLILYFLAINALAAALFFYDKRQSRSGGWRIPENTLLGIAILGGSIGAKIAQQKFRHKTHKQPFANILNGIIALQVFMAIALALPQTRALLLAPQ